MEEFIIFVGKDRSVLMRFFKAWAEISPLNEYFTKAVSSKKRMPGEANLVTSDFVFFAKPIKL